MRDTNRSAEIRAFTRDRDAVARALNPVPFAPETLGRPDLPDEFIDHIKGQRRYYRRLAATALRALIARGWRREQT